MTQQTTKQAPEQAAKRTSKKQTLDQQALLYHRGPPRGKITVAPTKPLENQYDLSLAYSPGVAAACRLIAENSSEVSEVTARGNLVAVVTNGTAVLGLGPIGPLAAKPVMEGKGVLFKKFANIDVFDIEITETDPDKFVDIVAALEPTFGGINLEDIRAPECFEIERQLRERLKIPVFHDDQHGTAIIVGAAVLNGLEILGKTIEKVKLVASGAGAASIACLNLLVSLGMKAENMYVSDSKGLLTTERGDTNTYQAPYLKDTPHSRLSEVMQDADVFLGLSAPNVLTAADVEKMAPKPLILALANPVPEIMPDVAKKARPDAIIATGRSDYPNQVNNVLCFPFLFRGALDVGATEINDAMKTACSQAIAQLTRLEIPETVANAYAGRELVFGPNYIIPTPFDPRLVMELPCAVARAAMETGVATRPIADFEAYRRTLSQIIFRAGFAMRHVVEAARERPARIVFADGEDPRVLQAVQTILDEKLAEPILIGRRRVLKTRVERAHLRYSPGEDVEICDPESDPRFRRYWETYHTLMGRRGVTPASAQLAVRTRSVAIGALMVQMAEAEGLVCGLVGRFAQNYTYVRDILGPAREGQPLAAMVMLVTPGTTLFLVDTHIGAYKTPEELCDIAWLAGQEVRRFGLEPKIAFVACSNFGSNDRGNSALIREAARCFRKAYPTIQADGEMHADAALDDSIRQALLPDSLLKEPANILIFPSMESANIAYNSLKILAEGQVVGPLILGTSRPVSILTNSATVRGVFNAASAIAADVNLTRTGRKSDSKRT